MDIFLFYFFPVLKSFSFYNLVECDDDDEDDDDEEDEDD